MERCLRWQNTKEKVRLTSIQGIQVRMGILWSFLRLAMCPSPEWYFKPRFFLLKKGRWDEPQLFDVHHRHSRQKWSSSSSEPFEDQQLPSFHNCAHWTHRLHDWHDFPKKERKDKCSIHFKEALTTHFTVIWPITILQNYIKKRSKFIASNEVTHSHKDHPRHAFAFMIISNNIRGQNAC